MKVPEDAQLKKPPENNTVQKHNTVEYTEPIVRPYGPRVQTVTTNSQNREEKSKIFIQDNSTSTPGQMKDYKFLKDGDHRVKIEKEHSKGIPTEPIVSIPVSIPGPHKILTKEEQNIKIKEEQSKGIDPCEEGMECTQDKENRRKEPIGNSEENLGGGGT